MHIYGPSQMQGPQAINSTQNAQSSQQSAPAESRPIHDELHISDAAKMVEQMNGIADVRYERVASIRSEIANGTYETPEKLDIAVSRFLDELG